MRRPIGTEELGVDALGATSGVHGSSTPRALCGFTSVGFVVVLGLFGWGGGVGKN